MKIGVGLSIAIALAIIVFGGMSYQLLTPTEAGAVAVIGSLLGVGLLSLIRR